MARWLSHYIIYYNNHFHTKTKTILMSVLLSRFLLYLLKSSTLAYLSFSVLFETKNRDKVKLNLCKCRVISQLTSLESNLGLSYIKFKKIILIIFKFFTHFSNFVWHGWSGSTWKFYPLIVFSIQLFLHRDCNVVMM